MITYKKVKTESGAVHIMRNNAFGSSSVCGTLEAQSRTKLQSIRGNSTESDYDVTCKKCIKWAEKHQDLLGGL